MDAPSWLCRWEVQALLRSFLWLSRILPAGPFLCLWIAGLSGGGRVGPGRAFLCAVWWLVGGFCGVVGVVGWVWFLVWQGGSGDVLAGGGVAVVVVVTRSGYGLHCADGCCIIDMSARTRQGEKMKLGVLNTSIATSDGTYTLTTITPEKARELAEMYEIDSAVGHESTAQILTTILGVKVPVSRQLFAQETGQAALVFKLNGRPEPGKELTRKELEEIGFTFKILHRTA